jgi:hypothetical protein
MSKLVELISLVYFSVVSYLYVAAFQTEISDKNTKKLQDVGLNLFSTYGGRWKFLTQLCLVIKLILSTPFFNIDFHVNSNSNLKKLAHVIYFSLGIFNAALVLFSFKNNILARFLNFCYRSVIFPVGLLVGVCFWGIYFVDRELIFSKRFDGIILPWHNHVMHTLPVFTSVIDNFFTEHFYEKSFIKGFLPLLLLSIAYIIW